MATPKQSYLLFCRTGIDVRPCNFSVDEASSLIDRSLSGQDISEECIAAGGIRKVDKKPPVDYAALYVKAYNAGRAAGDSCIPTPMVVQKHANPFDDNSAVVQQWHVPEGPCGFAGVVITPATCGFAKYLRKRKLSYKHYYGGEYMPVHDYNQSITRKEAHARAFAAVLKEAGIKAYPHSRLD